MEKNHRHLRNNRGFSLFEVFFCVAVIAVLAAIAAPIYQSFQIRNGLAISAATANQAIRRAKVLSEAVYGDSSWGVKIQPGSIVVFKGSAYASRDSGYDEVFDMSPTVTASGIEEIVFSKLAGLPSATGAIILTSSNNETKTITVNEKGAVFY